MTKDPLFHLGGYVKGGDPETWYPVLWDWVCQELGVRSVLDVGCGEGHSARFFKALGCEVMAVDGSSQALEDSVIPECQVLHDFTTGPFMPGRRFDLVWSCEFVEHVAEDYCGNFLAAFQASDKYIMMTHAVPGQKGHHHVNCRPARYWVKKLRGIGFRLHYTLTRRARLKAGHGYFRKSGLVFTRVTSRELVPDAPLLALLGLEWAVRRAFSYVRKHGARAAWRRLMRFDA